MNYPKVAKLIDDLAEEIKDCEPEDILDDLCGMFIDESDVEKIQEELDKL